MARMAIVRLTVEHLKAQTGRYRQRLKLERYWQSKVGQRRKCRQSITEFRDNYCHNCGALLTEADAEADHCTQCQTPLSERKQQ